MKAIKTKYHSPTDKRGSRITASDDDGNKITVPYDHGARNAHVTAALALCHKMGWSGTLQRGSLRDCEVFCWIDEESQITVNVEKS